jgi:hypothetical protein
LNLLKIEKKYENEMFRQGIYIMSGLQIRFLR